MLRLFYSFVFAWSTSNRIQIIFNRFVGVIANYFYRIFVFFIPISSKYHLAEDVIVSLTTYPERINVAFYCIQSLLRQNIRPFKTILWLASSQFPNGINSLPKKIINLQKFGLTICFTDDYKSYKKIYPALSIWQEKVIVTADDDTLYPEDWLKNLINVHNNYPNCVVCYRAHEITKENGFIKPYSEWNSLSKNVKGPSSSLLPVGVGGVLYPSCFFSDVVFDYSVIKKLAPTTDDIWLKIIGVLRHYKTVKVKKNSKEWFTIRGSQKSSLTNTNVVKGNVNDLSLYNLLKYYNCSNLDVFFEE